MNSNVRLRNGRQRPRCRGGFPLDGIEDLRIKLAEALPFLPTKTVIRLVRQYGTEAMDIFKDCNTFESLGSNFGNGVFQCELDWAIANEWVTHSEDFLWRRSKLGLRFSPAEKEKIDKYIFRQVEN